jgi:hypothetical protein
VTTLLEASRQALEALETLTKEMLTLRDELAERGGRPKASVFHQRLWDSSHEAYVDTAIPAAESLRQAIEQAEQPAQHDIPDLIAGALGVSRGTAYDLMREALAEQGQPVGTVKVMGSYKGVPALGCLISADGVKVGDKLYTAAPPRQPEPLTTEKAKEICARWTDEDGKTGSFGRYQIIRDTEAAHQIGVNK